MPPRTHKQPALKRPTKQVAARRFAHNHPTAVSAPSSCVDDFDGEALTMGSNRISTTDAIQFMNSLPDESIDLLLTDIPYARVNKPSNGLRVIDKQKANQETFNLMDFASEAFRVTKGNAVIFCGKEQFSSLYQYYDEQGATTRMVVWEKTNPMPMNGKYIFLSGVECAVHFRKKQAVFNENCQNTVFRYPNGSSRRHPTEKPLAMFKRFVEILSNPDNIVCDPCVGSGTTAVACKELGRQYICNDINPDYVKTAIGRLLNQNKSAIRRKT